MMKKTTNAIVNLVFALITVLFFLWQIGTISSPWSGKPSGTAYDVIKIVIAVIALGICIYNLKVSKGLTGISRIGNYLCMLCEAACFAFLLVNGQFSIFCFLNVAGAVMMFIPEKK